MPKSNIQTLTKTLISEGNIVSRRVVRDVLILKVEAFGHTYTIEAPYTKKCKITQEN